MLRLPVLIRGYRRLPIGVLLNGTLRTQQIRHKNIGAWFTKAKQPKAHRQDNSKAQIIIEDEDISNKIQHSHIGDLKHYLKTTEIPSKERSRILRTKLIELINEVPDFASNKDSLYTIDTVFAYLYDQSGRNLENVLPLDDLLHLFRSTSSVLLAQEDFTMPQYMATLSQELTKSSSDNPSDIYALVIDIGASLKFNDFENALAVVVHNSKKLPRDFTGTVFNHFRMKGCLDLLYFEAFLSVALREKSEIVNDDLVKEYRAYVELLFEKLNPNVHEYEDLNKNVYRIQELTFKMVNALPDNLAAGSSVQLLKFFVDLNTVVQYKDKAKGVELLLTKINDKSFEEIKQVLVELDLFDESLCELLLLEVSKYALFPVLHEKLTEFVIKDNVRYSENLKIQAKILNYLHNNFSLSEDELHHLIQDYVKQISTEELNNTQDKVVEALMVSGVVSPVSPLLGELSTWFKSTYGHLPTLNVYQYRLENALDASDSEAALQIFEESLRSEAVNWEHDSSPRTQLSLNRLIHSICDDDTSIIKVFPIFRKIKQHMTSQCNAEALAVLSKKMVAEECVGDAIELLKRQLPKMNTESPKRLLVTPTWAYAHKELFDQLHHFTVTFSTEETFETNWVLYGELHKYFAVPFETYLPTMKFFCEKDRLHAALVIFQRVKSLNELHGSHHHLPPSREMYMYLFKTFGDRLYEEGVIEIHEYLKMDINLPDTDIDLQNCLLDAYSNLQNVGKARDLFLAISSNAKIEGGVNEETARIMIKTYTYSDMVYVRKFWNNLSQFGVFPDYGIFKQYVIAHVYHGLVEDAFKLVSEIDEYNLELSPDLLLAMHNYCLEPKAQQEVAQWAIENHKEQWDEIKSSPLLRKASTYMPETNLLTGNELT